MRLVVTGCEGQVARSLVERAAHHAGIEVVAVGRPELDLENPSTVLPALAAATPDLVVSAAAYTAVDRAETEPGRAFAINAAGARHVAAAAASLGVPVVHLSTDYVFAGEGQAAHAETDQTGPQGVYGASKLAGEEAVMGANPHHFILRTAWVYSPFGANFVKTMLRLAGEREEVAVVSDQWGNPTSALDIADAILHAAPAMRAGAGRLRGVYHLAGSGETSWNGFARHIFAASGAHGGPSARVRAIATADYPTAAKRPLNSRLASTKFATAFEWTAPDWRHSTEGVVKRLVEAASG